ncbi:MAG: hypothetical protein NVV70_06205 [Cellulomonas sp.]|uniref:hypothetical protein n=1 Tax=Cellulomonas sp. TaxID=40001 RepID=UPI0025882A0C|nr:hypothetical protein [Cellulomonas sp.]MCR6647738.1 hypothetical protein [Cellulomonas sp.]MCR6703728.1 hypothetical protein [Cellulomonas sp.]
MRTDAVLEHLPTLYREGEVIGSFAGTWGVQLDGLDEAGVSVQRAHWFDSTPDLDEAVALAALLDIPPSRSTPGSASSARGCTRSCGRACSSVR